MPEEKKKRASKKREEILKERPGVKESMEKAPEGLEISIPQKSGLGKKKFRPNLKSIDTKRTLFAGGSAAPIDEQSPREIAKLKMKAALDPAVQTMFKGIVRGQRVLTDPKTNNPYYYALVWTDAGVDGFAGKMVMISYDDLIVPNGTKGSKVLDPASYIKSLEGAEIEFTLLDIVEEGGIEKYILGSRKRAALKRLETYWMGKKGNSYILKPGQMLEGRIVGVRDKGIRCEVFGIEFFIPGKELSHTQLDDCRTKFSPANRIKLLLKDVKRMKNGEIYAEFSHKDTFPNDVLDQFSGISVGDKITGITKVSGYDEKTGKFYAFVSINDTFDIRCTMRDSVSVTPVKGEKVTLVVHGIDYEALKMWGEIIHVSIKY